jgi:hypothetical protein
LILLGDFNVVGLKHETMEALVDSGFEVPEAIREPPNNERNSFYDQIAFMTPEKGFLDYLGDGDEDESESGTLKIYENTFSDSQVDAYGDYFEPLRRARTGNQPRTPKNEAKNRRNRSPRRASFASGGPGSSPTTSRSGCG